MLYPYSEALMLAIRLPQSIEKRLEKLARRTGRTNSLPRSANLRPLGS
jgi:predicted transcriptional regulator